MNGHTKIENWYIEWITSKSELTSLDIRILLFVFRKTIGWKKKEDKISFTQFQKATKCSRQAVMESIDRLEKIGGLGVVRKGKGKINVYKLVNYSCTTSQPEFTSSHAQTSQPQLTYKRNKETIQNNFKIEMRNGTPIAIQEIINLKKL